MALDAPTLALLAVVMACFGYVLGLLFFADEMIAVFEGIFTQLAEWLTLLGQLARRGAGWVVFGLIGAVLWSAWFVVVVKEAWTDTRARWGKS